MSATVYTMMTVYGCGFEIVIYCNSMKELVAAGTGNCPICLWFDCIYSGTEFCTSFWVRFLILNLCI